MTFFLCLPLLLGAKGAADEKVAAPPNAPSKVRWDERSATLKLDYHGTQILGATVEAQTSDGAKVQGAVIKMKTSVTAGEKVEQRLKFMLARPQGGVQLVLRGMVNGSEEVFAAETHSETQKRFPIVRNSVGLSRNLRNNAVYDRRWDWVLIGPGDGKTRIVPKRVEDKRVAFSWECHGSTLELAFRPRLYQKHKEFEYYQPWTYKVWKGSVTGYCTWWSYRGNFTQQTLDAMLAVFVEKHLPDFGYHYMQFDNCYQLGNGSSPQNWLNWNKKGSSDIFVGGVEEEI